MSEDNKKELQDLYKKVSELDETGRKVVKISVDALVARQEFEEGKDDGQKEEGSPA